MPLWRHQSIFFDENRNYLYHFNNITRKNCPRKSGGHVETVWTELAIKFFWVFDVFYRIIPSFKTTLRQRIFFGHVNGRLGNTCQNFSMKVQKLWKFFFEFFFEPGPSFPKGAPDKAEFFFKITSDKLLLKAERNCILNSFLTKPWQRF